MKMKRKASLVLALLVAMISFSLPACDRTHAEEESHQEHQRIEVTTPEVKDIILTQQYVCQIHSRRHIELRALQQGYLMEISVKEGQTVKKGDVLFKVIPILYKSKMEAEKAEANLAQLEYNNAKQLYEQKVISIREVQLYEAKLLKAEAKLKLAEAELMFTEVKAPFDGFIDRQYQQEGALVKEGEILTTLSDNTLMWVYFNVPEARYFQYKRLGIQRENSQLELPEAQVELKLADGTMFDHSAGNVVTVEGQFNNKTGNIAFRADFPNSQGLLRHGQTGTVLIHNRHKNALVIPQRATFEILDKRYVWVVGEDHVVHQRLITIDHELEDIFIIKSGLDAKDKIVLEGVREVRDGDKVEYEFHKPEEALAHQKFHAE